MQFSNSEFKGAMHVIIHNSKLECKKSNPESRMSRRNAVFQFGMQTVKAQCSFPLWNAKCQVFEFEMQRRNTVFQFAIRECKMTRRNPVFEFGMKILCGLSHRLYFGGNYELSRALLARWANIG